MDYKKKARIEKTIFGCMTMLGFMGVGACVGAFLVAFEKSLERKLSGIEFVLAFVIALAVIYFAYYVNVCLHETGHMIFGLMSGYQFHSLRFGKLMLVKRDGKLQFSIYKMPGTGGQCIMAPPDGDVEKMPVVLYNLGGLIVNFFVGMVGIVVYLLYKDSAVFVGIVALSFALLALLVLITNGIPFTQLGTDGANAIILYKSVKARQVFRNQLALIHYIANGYSVGEMPPEITAFDRTVPMDTPIITAQAISYYNYLSATKQYAEAKEMAEFILENAKSINQLHEKILHGEMLFMAIVIDRDMETAKKLFKEHQKELKSVAGFISMQRILYAYYALVEPDEKKATTYAKQFENSLKHYPYPKDAEMEKEQFDMITVETSV